MKINLKENKAFCSYAFKGIMIEKDGRTRPCCRFQDHRSDRLKLTEDTSITDITDSQYFEDIRKKMLAGEKVAGCVRCYREEESGADSMRMDGPNGIDTDVEDVELQYIEIETGRHCNLKCRICSADVSTKWNEDVPKLPSSLQHLYARGLDLGADYINTSLEHLSKSDCSKLKTLKVTGGEPFLSKSFLTFVDNIVKWGIAKNITVKLYTNTSYLPKKKYIDQLLKFKGVQLHMSIDDIGKRNDYQRSGSEWKTLESVANHWMELASKEEKLDLFINNSVSIFNLLTLNEFTEWVTQKQQHYKIFIQCMYQPIHWPRELAYYNWPRHIKNRMKESLAKHKKPSKNIKQLYSVLDTHPVTTISVKKEFLNTTTSLDSIRNENWEHVFPELFKLING